MLGEKKRVSFQPPEKIEDILLSDEDYEFREEDEIKPPPSEVPKTIQDLIAEKINRGDPGENKERAHRRPVPKLDTNSLLQQSTGLPLLRTLFRNNTLPNLPQEYSTPINRRAAILKESHRILTIYKHWAHTHFPKLTFEAFLERLERGVSKDTTIKEYLKVMHAKASDMSSEELAEFTEARFIADHLMAQVMNDDREKDEEENEMD
jgi:hypothetical protein